jgi:hypothetical protein
MIKIVCYNQIEFWHSRKKALDFYKQACRECEGSERDRYFNIVCDLEDGEEICHDGDSMPYDFLDTMRKYCRTEAPDESRDYGGQIWYPIS